MSWTQRSGAARGIRLSRWTTVTTTAAGRCPPTTCGPLPSSSTSRSATTSSRGSWLARAGSVRTPRASQSQFRLQALPPLLRRSFAIEAEDRAQVGPRDLTEKPQRKAPRPTLEINLSETTISTIHQALTRAEGQGLLSVDDAVSESAEVLPAEAYRLRQWRQLQDATLQRSTEPSMPRAAAQPVEDKTVLPANEIARDLLELVGSNQYITIVSEPGSGITTQVPQILLDDAVDGGMGATVNIICTQPRANLVARKIAEDRGEELGKTVGYHLHHDARLPRYGGSITYCTPGILLKQLQAAPDDVMDGISHIILDEVHEPDISLDFTLTTLKRTMIERARAGKNSAPKLILMGEGATVGTESFQNYFQDPRLGSLAGDCPVLKVLGPTFHVKHHYLSDIISELETTHSREHLTPLSIEPVQSRITSELAFRPTEKQDNTLFDLPPPVFTTLIAHIVKTTSSGAILVFLPDLDGVDKVKTSLLSSKPMGIDFQDETKFRITQLRSHRKRDQRKAFGQPGSGVREIILATSIAETSIIIPDVVAVIDSGTMRQLMKYNPVKGKRELQTVLVSRSSLAERAGKAGRVQPGHYFGLFHEDRIETLPRLPVPKVGPADLAHLSLSLLAQRNSVPIAEFLDDAIKPPSKLAVDAVVRDLTNLGVITDGEKITSLGRVLARVPLSPTLGKLAVMGMVFQCLEPMIILGVAAKTTPWDLGTYYTAHQASATRFRLAGGTLSEHLAVLNAYQALRSAVKKSPSLDVADWCRKRYIRFEAMHHIDLAARQVETALSEAGLINLDIDRVSLKSRQKMFRGSFGPKSLNNNSHNQGLICAVLAAGLNNNLAWLNAARTGETMTYSSAELERVEMPTSWVNSILKGEEVDTARDVLQNLPIMLFDSTTHSDTSKVAMNTATPVSPLTAVLFGNGVRAPTDADLHHLRKKSLFVDNLAAGPAGAERSGSEVNCPSLTVQSKVKTRCMRDDEARDLLLRFRASLEAMLERALRNMTRGLPAHQDPAKRLFVGALIKVVREDNFQGLRRALAKLDLAAKAPGPMSRYLPKSKSPISMML